MSHTGYLRENILGEATARAKLWGRNSPEKPSKNRKGPIWLGSGLNKQKTNKMRSEWVTGCTEVES